MTSTPNPILDPSRWVKNTLSQRVPGEPVKRCMLGWMLHISDVQEMPSYEWSAMKFEVIRNLPDWAECDITKFWDHPDTTHEMALEVLRRAGWIKNEAETLEEAGR